MPVKPGCLQRLPEHGLYAGTVGPQVGFGVTDLPALFPLPPCLPTLGQGRDRFREFS